MVRGARRISTSICYVFLTCLSSGVAGWGQTGQAKPAVVPTVSFTLDFPGTNPDHYGISVTSDGHASYVSDGKLSNDAEPGEPYSLDVTISQPTVLHIFELAKQANYFEGNVDSKNKKVAFTGGKSLMYKDAQKDTLANYNYSPVPAVQELTTLFQNLSATLEFGHRLQYDYHYQKLALDQETKAMEDSAGRGELIELGAIAPILQKIAADPSVINVVRARIERLLQHAGVEVKPPSGEPDQP
jgi:hypothetical protein